MNIVLLQDDFPPESVGGAGMVVGSEARALHKAGHQVRVIAATQDPSHAGESEWEGILVHRIYSNYHERWRAWRSLYNPPVVREARRVLEEWRPDIVHAHNVHYHLSYASLGVAKRTGAKVFLTAHDAMLFHYGKIMGPVTPWRQLRQYRLRYNPLRNVLIRYFLKHLDGLFAVSSALQNMLIRRGFSKAEVLYSGIDSAEWNISDEKIAAFVHTHRLENRKVILFGGRISATKGGGAVLAALPYIKAALPGAVVVLAGKENAYMRSLIADARQKNLDTAIVPVGWLSGDELKAAYHAANVVIQPSDYFEPFGLIALEAMVCGKPVVASRQGGLPEIIVEGETGYLVDPKDKEALSGRIIEVLTSPGLAARMGAAGYNRAIEKFSMDKHIDALLSAYESQS